MRLNNVKEIYSTQNNLMKTSDSTIENSYDIILENEDYTIGKIIEYTLYDLYYINKKSLTFCGFIKPHPHINISIIRLGFKELVEKTTVLEYINKSVDTSVEYYKKLIYLFNK